MVSENLLAGTQVPDFEVEAFVLHMGVQAKVRQVISGVAELSVARSREAVRLITGPAWDGVEGLKGL